MIGVIGAADSVRLLMTVADEDGLTERVIARPYASIEEAPALARDLDEVCQVLLLTGRYLLGHCVAAGDLGAAVQYVPHSGADLYATIVRLLRAHGHLPRISIDTIEPAILAEAFEDLELEPPAHHVDLEVTHGSDAVRSIDELAAFHEARFRAGDVDVCLTCVGAVYQRLRDRDVPAIRIRHTRSVMREALRQAHLAERLMVTEGTQPAAVLISMPRSRASMGDEAGPYEAQRRQLRAREAVLDIAEQLQGRLAEVDETTSMVYTSRGIIERVLARVTDGHDGPFSADRLPQGMHVGVGLGRTVAMAEDNARLALAMGERDGTVHLGLPSGEIVEVRRDQRARSYQLRETRPHRLRVAKKLGLGPLALARLTRALHQVDASAVTATELARAYGIEARSARRLITALQRAGIATRLGRQGGTGAGRPQTVYRIDLARLVGTELTPARPERGDRSAGA